MSDITGALPIKTLGDLNEYVRSKIYDSTGANAMEVDADNDAHVKAKLRDDAGNPVGTEANPIYVTGAESPGDEIEDYKTSAAVVKDAFVTHDYTVTAAKTFRASSVVVSSGDAFKVSVEKETAPASGTYDTLYVAFASAANPLVVIQFNKILKQVATAKIRLTITNRGKDTDLYSTLTGIES